ncbi:RraA family protein [Pseudodesulfovibrio thermohalotolerans]|uniref:RraA family protein n=1 Tax=Pseudodesulfovibrio thermohalotolerans TaxID=2880651 RepID=UPI002442A891|nr:RraA family protein [Pseudodesulfovibrio thermohalotolerans]WFS62608.1 RraA family protein [Pseudodesulfovibrio thermohalotolerans]
MTPEEKRICAHRLEQCYSGAVYDALREKGIRDCVLPPEFAPLAPGRRLAGPVYAVEGERVTTSDHETLLEWTGLLSKVPSGTVLMIQPNDMEQAYMGELSAETLSLKGVRGAIIDGNCRDTDFIVRSGFRVFAKGKTPRDVVGTWLPRKFDAPVLMGGVTVNPGDFVVADEDGIVIVPGDLVEEITTRAEEFLRTESLVRKAILEGEDPQQAYIKYGKF